MVSKAKKRRRLIIGISMMAIISLSIALHLFDAADEKIVGGNLHLPDPLDMEILAMSSQDQDTLRERFQRPSKQAAFPNPYSFGDFSKTDDAAPLISEIFTTPEEVILAYFAILESAANMIGYSGGCGTIGHAKQPYAYAYELLTEQTRSEMDLDQFIESFAGIGHITLLYLYPAYAPPETPPDTQYYMVEIETITGSKTQDANPGGSYFAYYYGIVTVETTGEDGFKIKRIDYLPEDFLCAPYHGWSYDAEAMIDIVYRQNLNLIDSIEKTEQADRMLYLYASGNGRQYRFDFVRLTNGNDLLLHENILVGSAWQETDLLTGNWQEYKFSVRQFS